MVFIRRLIWDNWNIAHIARHQVVKNEVEEVCYREPVVSETYGGRFRVVGPTERGRMLTAIVAPEEEEGVYYVVTARPADKKERESYKRQEQNYD